MAKQLKDRPFFLLLSSRGRHLDNLIKSSNFNTDYKFKYKNYIINAIYNIFHQKNKNYKYILTDAVEFSLFALIISKIKNLKIIFRLRGDIWSEYEEIPWNNFFKRIFYIILISIFEYTLNRSFLCLPCGCGDDLKKKFLKKIKKINVEKLRVSISLKNTNNIKKKKYLLSITNFQYKKKSFEIFKYLKEIIKFLNEFNFELYIFGKGEYKNEFLLELKKYNSKRVKVFDYRNNILNYQKNCFLFLHTTNLDAAMPTRSILECMSFGKPIIVSNKFGINKVITNKKNGFLISNKNQLSNYFIYLLNHKNYKKISSSSLNTSKKFSHKIVSFELMNKINACE